jgi:hypothetical protein
MRGNESEVDGRAACPPALSDGPTPVDEVDPVTIHRHSFLPQPCDLVTTHWDSPIGAHHSVPRHIILSGGKDLADQTRRSGIDVAIGLDESLGNGSNPVQDASGASTTTQPLVPTRGHGVLPLDGRLWRVSPLGWSQPRHRSGRDDEGVKGGSDYFGTAARRPPIGHLAILQVTRICGLPAG